MVKLVVFDLDGTLADTLADLAASVNYALDQCGLPTYPVDDYRYFVGNGVDNLVRTVLADHYTPERAAAVKKDFSAYSAGHSMDYTAAYPGLSDLLACLSDEGYLTAVISNKPDAFVPAILRSLYPDYRFSYLSGQQPDIPRKPAPDALLRLLGTLGVSAEDTLYIGDSDVDVRFAHNADVKVCGVSWGFRGRGELTQAGADAIADTADELLRIIHEHS